MCPHWAHAGSRPAWPTPPQACPAETFHILPCDPWFLARPVWVSCAGQVPQVGGRGTSVWSYPLVQKPSVVSLPQRPRERPTGRACRHSTRFPAAPAAQRSSQPSYLQSADGGVLVGNPHTAPQSQAGLAGAPHQTRTLPSLPFPQLLPRPSMLEPLLLSSPPGSPP